MRRATAPAAADGIDGGAGDPDRLDVVALRPAQPLKGSEQLGGSSRLLRRHQQADANGLRLLGAGEGRSDQLARRDQDLPPM